MTKKSIKTKIIAALLAVLTVFSVVSVSMTSAFAEENSSSSTPAISLNTNITNEYKVQLDKDLSTAKKMTSSVLFKVIDECTSWGKFFTPALSGLLDAFVVNDDPTLAKVNEISDKIDKLFDKIDAAETSLKAVFTNDLGIKSFYDKFIEFKAQTKAMQKKINEINESSLSNTDKLAKIGSLTGSYYEWKSTFEDVLGALNELFIKPSMVKEGNIFDLTYNYYTNDVMLSGEALEKAKPICDFVMETYSAGCATILQSLSAQLFVHLLPDTTKAAINKGYMAHITDDPNDIISEISEVSRYLLASDATTSITGFVDATGKTYPLCPELQPYSKLDGTTYYTIQYGAYYLTTNYYELISVKPIYTTAYSGDCFMSLCQKTFNTSKSILVDHGHANKELSSSLAVLNHSDNEKADGKHHYGMGSLTAEWFNDTLGANAMNADQVKALANEAGSKGISIRTLLDNCGFDTSNIPQNANIVTQSAWDDSVDRASVAVGYNYQKAYYKGINIDSANPSEQTIQLLDCGFNIWNDSNWNYMLGGYACAFKTE